MKKVCKLKCAHSKKKWINFDILIQKIFILLQNMSYIFIINKKILKIKLKLNYI
jgi:hypothetical protein